ncbi:hypothetical protein [Bradyrhizobium genosp. A]|uniref:hypothetical protein n=1 Tax=Bradyrhizobium genosp. A TaxID=83626 RepID=UPI003CEB5044
MLDRSGPKLLAHGGAGNFAINSGSGAMSFRSTGDAAGTGISWSYESIGLA